MRYLKSATPALASTRLPDAQVRTALSAVRDSAAVLRRALLLGATVIVWLAGSAGAHTFEGRVVRIVDGDSITVLDARNRPHEVRLAGIDAPELGQPFGRRAKQHLSALVFGQTVRVHWDRRDRYQRRSGKVWVASPDSACRERDCAKSLDVGLHMVSIGLAWHYKHYQHEQTPEDRMRYALHERQARARRDGLWAFSKPVPPWRWREGVHDSAQSWPPGT
jgi:endonuclease YncB( thermonuclease family)